MNAMRVTFWYGWIWGACFGLAVGFVFLILAVS